MKKNPKQSKNLVGVCETSHTTHDAKDIVVGGVNADLGGAGTSNGGGRDNKLKDSVIDAGEIACARWLVFLRAKSERVNIDTSVWVASVVLVWLNKIEVCAFAFREAILTVKLELSSDDRVFTPAVHLEGSFGKDESTGIRDTTLFTCLESSGKISVGSCVITDITCGAVGEKTRSIDNRVVSAA